MSMEISLNLNDTSDILDFEEERGELNGREIRTLEGTLPKNFFQPAQIKHGSACHLRGHIKPMMTRAPDEVEAEVEGGYNENNGGYVHGKITWTWKEKEKEGNTEGSSGGDNEGTTSKDVDSRDREPDKH